MILNQEDVGKIGNLILDFEVVFRSFISGKILGNFDSLNSFKNEMNKIKSLYNNESTHTSPLNYSKTKNRISNYTNKKIEAVYDALIKTQQCTEASNMIYDEQNILMVSEVIDLIVLLYNPNFIEIGTKFGGGDILEQELELFRKIRNAVSHRGSKIVKLEEAISVVKFIQKNLEFIDSVYYWYLTKDKIEKNTIDFLQNISTENKTLHNLNQVNKKHSLLLEREKEYGLLKERVIGKNSNYRTSGTVLVQGSGGIGKTALVLELCYEILANEQLMNFDFIMFLTSKEEELSYNSVTGELKLDKLIPKYKGLDDVKSSLIRLFNKRTPGKAIEEILVEYKGIIVLDNFETLSLEEQEKISDFIMNCPETIQFIITSRPSEKILENYILGVPINLLGFKEEQSIKFIKNYLNEYSIQIDESNNKIKEFAKESCGNSLILVTGLQRVISNLSTLDELIITLRNYSSSEVDTISDFMYKNMMEDTIRIVGERFNNKSIVIDILNVMYLYGDPIDIYSIKDITKLSAKSIEETLSELQIKYVVFKQGNLYKLDDLAVKFILVKKVLPPAVQLMELKRSILDYKNEIEKQLEGLADRRNNNPKLNIILENWSPNSYSEEIAVAQAFHAHNRYQQRIRKLVSLRKLNVEKIYNEILSDFESLKYRGGHPYIYFQQARVLKLLLKYRDSKNESTISKIINDIIVSYSEANYRINSTHTYVLNTKSHAALLMQNGAFLVDNNDSVEATKLLEEAVLIYNNKFSSDSQEQINRLNAHYYLILAETNLSLEYKIYEMEYLKRVKINIEKFNNILKNLDSRNVHDISNKKVRIKLIDIYISLKRGRKFDPSANEKDYYNKHKSIWMTKSLSNNKFIDKLDELFNEKSLTKTIQ